MTFIGNTTLGQEQANLRGTVVDGKGLPVQGAKVMIGPEGVIRTQLIDSYTDSVGVFEVRGLRPGRYNVHAFKNEDGYGDPTFAFFALEQPATLPPVEIVAGQTSNIRINLGSPAARIIGDVINADTGKPTEKARFRVTVADRPEIFISSNPDGNGHFVIPVPSVPVELEVTMPGFVPWHSGRLLLPRGTMRTLTIPLKQIKPER